MTFIILKTRLEGTKHTKITPLFFFQNKNLNRKQKQQIKQKTEMKDNKQNQNRDNKQKK